MIYELRLASALDLDASLDYHLFQLRSLVLFIECFLEVSALCHQLLQLSTGVVINFTLTLSILLPLLTFLACCLLTGLCLVLRLFFRLILDFLDWLLRCLFF